MENQSVTEEILGLERAALDEWSTGNPAGYTQFATEDFTYFDDIGAQCRIDGIQAAREYGASLTEHIPEHRYEIIDPMVQVYGDVAILTFRYQPISLEGGKTHAVEGFIGLPSERWRVADGPRALVHDQGELKPAATLSPSGIPVRKSRSPRPREGCPTWNVGDGPGLLRTQTAVSPLNPGGFKTRVTGTIDNTSAKSPPSS